MKVAQSMHRTSVNVMPTSGMLYVFLCVPAFTLGMGNHPAHYNPYIAQRNTFTYPSYVNPHAITTPKPVAPLRTPEDQALHNELHALLKGTSQPDIINTPDITEFLRQNSPLQRKRSHSDAFANNDTQSLNNELQQLLQQNDAHHSTGAMSLSRSLELAISQAPNQQVVAYPCHDTQSLHDELNQLMQQSDMQHTTSNTSFTGAITQAATQEYHQQPYRNVIPIDQQYYPAPSPKRMRTAEHCYAPENGHEYATQSTAAPLADVTATHVPSTTILGHNHTLPIRATQNPGSLKESETIVRNITNGHNQERYMSVFDIDKGAHAITGSTYQTFIYKKPPYTYSRPSYRKNISPKAILALIQSRSCTAEKFMELITTHKMHPSRVAAQASLFVGGIDSPEIKQVVTQLESMNAQADSLRYNPSDYITLLTRPASIGLSQQGSPAPQTMLGTVPAIKSYIKNISTDTFSKKVVEEFVHNTNPSNISLRRLVAKIRDEYTQAQQYELAEYHLQHPLAQNELQGCIENLLPREKLIEHFKKNANISELYKTRNSNFIRQMIPHLPCPLDLFHILMQKKTAQAKPIDETVFRYAAQSVAKHHPQCVPNLITLLKQDRLADRKVEKIVLKYLQPKKS